MTNKIPDRNLTFQDARDFATDTRIVQHYIGGDAVFVFNNAHKDIQPLGWGNHGTVYYLTNRHFSWPTDSPIQR